LAEEGERIVPRMREILQHEEACYWACLVLSELGPAAKDALPELKPVLEHPDPEVRLQALLTLGEIGSASSTLIPDIAKALRTDEFGGVRYAAAYALGKIGTEGDAAAALEEAVGSDDAFLKMTAAWALARNNPDDRKMVERAVRLIVDAFKSDDIHLRRAAAKAAVDFDISRDVLGPLLVEALADKDPLVVRNAVETLAQLGPKALAHVDDALQNEQLRFYALMLIYRMGPEAAPAVPALINALQNVSPDEVQFRRELQFALGSIGAAAKPAAPILIKSLSSSDAKISASAAYALGKIGPDARAAVPALRQNLRSDNQLVKLASIMALLRIQPRERSLGIIAAPLLLKALDNENEIVRAEAAMAVGKLGALGRRAMPRLKEMLKDESPFVRDAAAEALKELGG
jgi:HEAT repeat protein